MLFTQRGPVALGTSKEPVADNQFAANGAELLNYGILDDVISTDCHAVTGIYDLVGTRSVSGLIRCHYWLRAGSYRHVLNRS